MGPLLTSENTLVNGVITLLIDFYRGEITPFPTGFEGPLCGRSCAIKIRFRYGFDTPFDTSVRMEDEESASPV